MQLKSKIPTVYVMIGIPVKIIKSFELCLPVLVCTSTAIDARENENDAERERERKSKQKQFTNIKITANEMKNFEWAFEGPLKFKICAQI